MSRKLPSPHTSAGLQRSIAVTVLGVLTLLWAAVQAIGGGSLIFGGAGLNEQMKDDTAVGGFAFFFRLIAGFMVLIGLIMLLQGLLGMLAGVGALLRRQWGRILTFLMAALAILWGLLLLSSYQGMVDAEITLGAAQLLYGLFALAVLIAKGAEFSLPQATLQQ